MNSARGCIFPGIVLGCLLLVGFSSLAIVSEPVSAQAEANAPASVPKAQKSARGCGLSAAVPEEIRQWCELIENAAQEQNLDPALIAAVITQESSGDPSSYSSSGAVGLMQVMPKDGLAASFQCIHGPCFAARPGMDELFDPHFNVQYGTQMLAGLVRKHGNLRDALRAYGPMDVGYTYADLVLGIYAGYQAGSEG